MKYIALGPSETGESQARYSSLDWPTGPRCWFISLYEESEGYTGYNVTISIDGNVHSILGKVYTRGLGLFDESKIISDILEVATRRIEDGSLERKE